VTEPSESIEKHTFKVGPWEFVPKLKLLKGDDGLTVKLEDKIALVLETLCRHDGAPVSKQELITAVWDGREVSEQTVPVAISKLRKFLGDNSTEPTMLETVPRKGYRLMVPPSEAVMAEALLESEGMSSLSRLALAVSLLAIILVGWSFYRSDNVSITSPADAEKPGIILTINDVRTAGGDQSQMQRAIALSELASFYLSQVSDVLVIRHWWNLDAPDPTGGIYTRYGAKTPIYSVKAMLIEDTGGLSVSIQLSNPKTDELIWTGMHVVSAGTGDYFATLEAMLQTIGVAGTVPDTAAQALSPAFEDERYWVGRYFAQLSSEGAAKTAGQAWQAIALDNPGDPLVTSAQQALSARWGIESLLAQNTLPEADTGYVGLVDRGAVALFRDKDADRATRLLEAALEIAPGDHYALSVLAEARLMMGDKEGGIEAYRKAIRLAPFARAYGARLAAVEAPADASPN